MQVIGDIIIQINQSKFYSSEKQNADARFTAMWAPLHNIFYILVWAAVVVLFATTGSLQSTLLIVFSVAGAAAIDPIWKVGIIGCTFILVNGMSKYEYVLLAPNSDV